MKTNLEKLQNMCEGLGIGHRGYPATDAQVTWLRQRAEELAKLAKQVEEEE